MRQCWDDSNQQWETFKNTKPSAVLTWLLQKSKRSDISALCQKQTVGIHPINIKIHALVARLHSRILSGFPSSTSFLSDCIMSLNQYMPVVSSSKSIGVCEVYLETLLRNYRETHSLLRSDRSYSYINVFLMCMCCIQCDVVQRIHSLSSPIANCLYLWRWFSPGECNNIPGSFDLLLRLRSLGEESHKSEFRAAVF